jgi:hypothetical protein
MSRRTKSIIIFIISLLFFFSCSFPLLQIRERSRLISPQETALKKLPPELVFTTVLLGGFRGILADFLWLRAQKLQDEGKYFELVQLSDWIGLLEPYIPEVWTFNAWNLSYNISVEFPTPEERWNWVYQGIKLLRNKALKYIPNSSKIYQQISWIYYHKIASYSDLAHAYYKRAWARMMKDTFGNMKLEEIASNSSYEELIKDKNVEAIISSFQDRQIDILKSLDQISDEGFSTNLPEELRVTLESPSFRKIEAYLRAKTLKEKFKMDPKFMLELEKKYFPFDWKSAAANSLYWIEEGKRKSKDMREIDYRRMVYFSLNDLLESGKIDIKTIDNEEILIISPDLKVAPILNDYYEDTLKNLTEEMSTGTKSSHRDFLRRVILLAYTTNNLPIAQKYYRYLKDKYPGEVRNLPFSDYVALQFMTGLKDANVSELTASLTGILYQSYWYLSIGEDERSAGLQSLARIMYERVSENNIMFKKLFPTFDILRKSALDASLTMLPPPLASSLRNRLGIQEPTTPEEK